LKFCQSIRRNVRKLASSLVIVAISDIVNVYGVEKLVTRCIMLCVARLALR
jgi:hypothetical protein